MVTLRTHYCNHAPNRDMRCILHCDDDINNDDIKIESVSDRNYGNRGGRQDSGVRTVLLQSLSVAAGSRQL